MDKSRQFNIWYVIVAAGLIMLVQSLWLGSTSVEKLPYSEFLKLVEVRKVSDVVVKETTVEGRLAEPINGNTHFVTNRVEPGLAETLTANDIAFTGGTEKTLLGNLLSWILPAVIFLGIWYFVFRNFAARQGGMMGIGKSKAKVYVQKETGVTFEDVAGVDSAESELKEVVAFLKEPEKFTRLGAKMPRGILLVGPPGTGKTLLARAVAGEAGVPFFSIAGSEFVEMFVGVGAARVRDLFAEASKVAPCIIFIDEIDTLGQSRAGPTLSGHDEKAQTLNQLLNELDGFDTESGIVLLAATNRPEVLDPALTRAGRFDRRVVVDRPDRTGRAAILKVHLKKVTIDPDVDLEKIAGITIGFTGADLANLVNEAALVATRREGRMVKMEDFTKAVERIVVGAEQRTKLMHPKDRERVAYHEMGHALAAASIRGADPVHKVSIIPRSIGALGYTMQRPTEDKFLITAEDLNHRMVVLLAGRAAEELTFGQISTGAADDLTKATAIARQSVARFGMTEELGQVVLEEPSGSYLEGPMASLKPRNYSEDTAREIDLAVRRLIDEGYDHAKTILTDREADLRAGATLLLERETITPDDFPPLKPTPEILALQTVE